MSIERILVIIIGFLVTIGVVKFSAQLAYKRPVRWGEAFVQWIMLAVLGLLAGFLLEMLDLGVRVSDLFNMFG